MDPDRTDYDDGPPGAKNCYARERWVVLVPSLAIGAVFAGAWCLAEVPGSLQDRSLAFVMILAGPLTGFVYGGPTCLEPIAMIAPLVMLTHPLRTNMWTGVATAVALAILPAISLVATACRS